MFEQSQPLDKNATRSLIESVQANLDALEEQKERVGEPARKSLEAQIRVKQTELQSLRLKLEELEQENGIGHT